MDILILFFNNFFDDTRYKSWCDQKWQKRIHVQAKTHDSFRHNAEIMTEVSPSLPETKKTLTLEVKT